MSAAPRLSVVVPLKDEAECLGALHGELVQALERLGEPWEIVYVDDGSTDGSPAVLAGLTAGDDRVTALSLDRNYGQSTATIAGAQAARGEWLATLDADGQNDPADLVDLWSTLHESGADGVIGVRVSRHDSWIRRASSRIANAARDRLTGDRIADVGCSLRILRRRALLEAIRFEGMHRFLPTLVRMAGYSLVERPVSHRPRRLGRSKYGIHNRLWRGLADLLVVRRLRRRAIRYRLRSRDRSFPGGGGR